MYSGNNRSGTAGGTSIMAIKNKQRGNFAEGNYPNHGYTGTGYQVGNVYRNDNAHAHTHTHTQYNENPPNPQPSNNQPYEPSTEEIDNMIDSINKGIDQDKKIIKGKKKDEYDDTDDDTDDEYASSKEKRKKNRKKRVRGEINTNTDAGTFSNRALVYLKDFILLWALYVLMSQDFVKNLISSHIKALNPVKISNSKMKVPLSGMAIYGGILCLIYFILRYIFIHKFI